MGAFAYPNRRNQVGIAADKGFVLNLAAVLMHSVIINGHNTASKVYVLPNITVPDMGQVEIPVPSPMVGNSFTPKISSDTGRRI